jgi:hypothetical protein
MSHSIGVEIGLKMTIASVLYTDSDQDSIRGSIINTSRMMFVIIPTSKAIKTCALRFIAGSIYRFKKGCNTMEAEPTMLILAVFVPIDVGVKRTMKVVLPAAAMLDAGCT